MVKVFFGSMVLNSRFSGKVDGSTHLRAASAKKREKKRRETKNENRAQQKERAKHWKTAC